MAHRTLRRTLAAGAACLALGVTSVAVVGPAGAADADGAARHHRRHLTAEQRRCLADQGVTRPIRPLTEEKVAQLREAAQACDIELPKPRLTAEQRQCLADQGVTRPIRPLTKEKVAQLREAAQACDIELPRRHHRRHLTAEQRQCLADQGVTRPIRPLTPERRQQLKDAAEACGITRAPAGAQQT